MVYGVNYFDGGQIHYLDNWKELALKISSLLGPNCTRFTRCHFRAQKFLIFWVDLFQWPSKWISPHQNYYVQRYEQQIQLIYIAVHCNARQNCD
jgi:hypothetical protein